MASLQAALDSHRNRPRRTAHLGEHVPRHLERDVLQRDGVDLVLTMSRAQLREVTAIDAVRWRPRAFTLKKIVRRARMASGLPMSGSRPGSVASPSGVGPPP